MVTWLLELLRYTFELLVLTLGVLVACGFAVRLCSRLVIRLMGRGSVAIFQTTAAIGTPVHESGHAIMCFLFGHRITDMKLWIPGSQNGVYGYVMHSYSRRNLWSRLGNLFIGFGPIFSGLAVVVLALWLCFPAQWGEYLALSNALVAQNTTMQNILEGVFSLLSSLPAAFSENWWRSLIGILLILPVSLHISLSWMDVKNSLSALPIYVLLVLVFAVVTTLLGLPLAILSGLRLFNLRLLSLFSLVVIFAAVWVAIAAIVWLTKLLVEILF